MGYSPWGHKESDITEEAQKQQQEHGKINLLVSLVIVFFYDSFIDGFPGGSDGKASAYNAGDLGLIPGQGRSLGRRKWQPTLVLLPRKSMDRGAWKLTVPGVAMSQTRLNDSTQPIWD